LESNQYYYFPKWKVIETKKMKNDQSLCENTEARAALDLVKQTQQSATKHPNPNL